MSALSKRTSVVRLICMGVLLSACHVAESQISLSASARAEVLNNQIVAAIAAGKFEAALRYLDDYHKLEGQGIPLPPPLLYQEALMSKAAGKPLRAYDALTVYLNKSDKYDRHYAEAVRLYTGLEATKAVREGLERRTQAAPTVYTGRLSVMTSPSGARLFVDGAYSGIAPEALMDLIPGEHTIRIELEGYKTTDQLVRITANRDLTLSVRLDKRDSPIANEVSEQSAAADIRTDSVTTTIDESGCPHPLQVNEIPNGMTANKTQMLDAKHRLEEYNSAMNTYFVCLKILVDGTTDKSLKAHLAQMNNGAVDELQRNVSCFNAQLSVFKSTGGGTYGAPISCAVVK